MSWLVKYHWFASRDTLKRVPDNFCPHLQTASVNARHAVRISELFGRQRLYFLRSTRLMPASLRASGQRNEPTDKANP